MKKFLLSLATVLAAMSSQAESMRRVFFDDFGAGVFDHSCNGIRGFYNQNYWTISQGTRRASQPRYYQDLYDRYDRGGRGNLGLMVNPSDFYNELFGYANLDYIPAPYNKRIYGSDHTKPGSNTTGAFVYVIPANPDLLKKEGKSIKNVRTIYENTIEVFDYGKTKYRASMWISSVGEKDGDFTVKLSAISNDGSILGSVIKTTPGLKMSDSKQNPIQWREVSVEFNSWEFLTFKGNYITLKIELMSEKSYHYGFCIDDIKLEAGYTIGKLDLPSLETKMEPTVGSNQIKISSNITYDDLEDYFGNNCKNVCYEWYHKPVGSNTFVKFGGGQFGGDMNLLTLPLNAYDLSRNGTWKLVMWDGVRRLEKEIVVNYTLDQIKQRRTRASFDDFDQDLDFVNDGESLFINEENDKISNYYTIYDMSGRVVVYSNDQPVNIAPLKNGIYILDMNGKQTKFIKK
ncbi:MAG: T9SS type A sorting domain-containing protein [Paludibacteraceae bacterium]|nr:T9SS type A sorting domain-containing protein [Paludibacteraceae bacterium]